MSVKKGKHEKIHDGLTVRIVPVCRFLLTK